MHFREDGRDRRSSYSKDTLAWRSSSWTASNDTPLPQTGLQEGNTGSSSAVEPMVSEQGLTRPSFHTAAEEQRTQSSLKLCRAFWTLPRQCLTTRFPPDHQGWLPQKLRDTVFQASICVMCNKLLSISISPPLHLPSDVNLCLCLFICERSKSLFSRWPH